jgi:hypothetical protein
MTYYVYPKTEIYGSAAGLTHTQYGRMRSIENVPLQTKPRRQLNA